MLVYIQGEYVGARDNLEVALAVISRPIPTSYYGIVTGLLWSLFSHVLFQVDWSCTMYTLVLLKFQLSTNNCSAREASTLLHNRTSAYVPRKLLCTCINC